MKKIKGIFVVSVIVLTQPLIGFSVSSFASEPENNEREISNSSDMTAVLNLLGTRMQENYNQIKTWKGKADVEIHYLHTGKNAEEIFHSFTEGKGRCPDEVFQIIQERFEFAVDVPKQFVYTDSFRSEPSRYLDAATGQDLGNKGANPYRLTCLATPDYLLRAEPQSINPQEKKIAGSRAERIPSKKDPLTGFYKDSNDPRFLFTPGGTYPWKSFEFILDKIQREGKIEFDGYSYKIYEGKRDNQEYFKIVHPAVVNLERNKPDHYVVTTKLCSKECGYNFTKWEITRGDGVLLTEYIWQYERLEGVFLPKVYIEKQYDAAGRLIREKKMTFVQNLVNQPIPPEQFSYKNLHLKDRDLLMDKIEKRIFQYKESDSAFKEVQNVSAVWEK
ncbi:MAG TPA: hypothetical protein PK054_04255 [Anaerohalosphaeraceae bacterium]|nr:hypothetical protein [Anaerohalosphaeraceae bacterium]HOL87718.1 hypothetical protein [Anaerohalosphaeraceae bacterium]HPP55775.1 hypothetical protein [Anaerohalosphaeraceae bacterium]